MSIRRIRTQDGFTLAEILVATSILVVIGAIMLSFFIQGSSLWQLVTTQSDVRSTARNAMNYMTQELRNAELTTTFTLPNNSVSFYLPADSATDSNELIIDDSGDTEWDTSNEIQYQYLSGSKQLCRLENGNPYIIANDVTLIEFSALHDNELKIVLTLEKLTPQHRIVSVTLTSIVKLRNQ